MEELPNLSTSRFDLPSPLTEEIFQSMLYPSYKVVELMSKETPLLPIGPTLPSSYLDKTNMDDKDYGLSLFNSSPSSNATAIEWLRTKPPGSVIYVSFGSMWCLEKEQIEEVAWALKHCQYNFLWVVKFAERPRLPEGFIEEMSTLGKAMFLEWCSQLQVLENDAVGCFVTHSGWNSTLEALAFGVPLVCMPQWSDQPTNAKLVQDLWKVGVKAHRDESGIVPREELGKCIIEVMKGDKGEGMRGNARKWSALAKQAFADGGSSACNVDLFVSKFSR